MRPAYYWRIEVAKRKEPVGMDLHFVCIELALFIG